MWLAGYHHLSLLPMERVVYTEHGQETRFHSTFGMEKVFLRPENDLATGRRNRLNKGAPQVPLPHCQGFQKNRQAYALPQAAVSSRRAGPKADAALRAPVGGPDSFQREHPRLSREAGPCGTVPSCGQGRKTALCASVPRRRLWVPRRPLPQTAGHGIRPTPGMRSGVPGLSPAAPLSLSCGKGRRFGCVPVAAQPKGSAANRRRENYSGRGQRRGCFGGLCGRGGYARLWPSLRAAAGLPCDKCRARHRLPWRFSGHTYVEQQTQREDVAVVPARGNHRPESGGLPHDGAASHAHSPCLHRETAEFDCLHDEALLYAQRLRDQGAQVTVYETKATVHGYDFCWDSPITQESVGRRVEAMEEMLGK